MANTQLAITIATQNVGGMRSEIQLRQGKKHALLRKLIKKDTDFVVLTEARADSRAAAHMRVKWGLKPSHFSLHPEAHGGVIVLSKPEHKVIDGSRREATTPGHMAAAVYEIGDTRIIVVGLYGESASNDGASVAIMTDLRDTLTELKHIYNTHYILLAGDFNVTMHPEDANTPNHQSKPRTAHMLRTIMEDNQLTDLALAANNTNHTWFRHSNQGHSSRIDLILTSMTVRNLKVNSTLLFLDHVYLEATFGNIRIKQKRAMKDFILGSDEYLIRAQDIIEAHLSCYGTKPPPPDDQQPDHNDNQATCSDDLTREFDRPTEGHTALHAFNTLIRKLQRLHEDISYQHYKTVSDKLQEPSRNLIDLKRRLKKARTEGDKDDIHEQICDIQKTIQDDLEAKDAASQLRISNFYKDRTGRMVPETFSCIKDGKRSRTIHRLDHEGRTITDPEEIVDVMQKWYECTAEHAPQQLLTLDQFLQEQDLHLPQLSAEDCSDLEEEFTVEEVRQAISEAKAVSAPGPSGQTISFFKLLFMHTPHLMTQALNQLVFVPLLSTEKHLQWIQERKVIYIPKKPRPTSPGDYRPLSMLEVLYKIPARILAHRLTQVLPKLIGPHQHGFMPKKGIQEPTLLATHLIEEANKHNKPLQLVSVDIEKAFDKVGHKVITQALRAFGVPEIMVQALQQYTLVGYAKVEVNGRRGILITIRTGSGQGDPLSSILFLLASEPLNRALVANHTAAMYTTNDGLRAGPQLFADDNQLPLAITNTQALQSIMHTYDTYKQVSGLGVNIQKTTALCINTPEDVLQDIRQLGITTPEHIKHLGIHLGKTLESTITETMLQIAPKAITRRIMATTPPTDLLHRATLINVALLPIYNHVFMALPVSSEHTKNLFTEVLNFLWTRQQGGETVSRRRRVARDRISADLNMGGLRIPHPDDIIRGFQQNLIQRIILKESQDIPSLLPSLLRGILARMGSPSLECHVDRLGPAQWKSTGNRMLEHNTMLGQAFLAVAELLEWHEKDKASWHCAAINGHSVLANVSLSNEEAQLLEEQGLITVSQLFEETVTGGLSRSTNNAQLDLLADRCPWLPPKLRALTNDINRCNLPTANKHAIGMTSCALLMTGEKHLSQINKKITAQQNTQRIRIAPAYLTRVRDGVYRPDEDTFHNAFKVLDIPDLPSKTKETAFEILNRTVWTNNKAFKSQRIDNPDCERCGAVETMEHLLIECDHYSAPLWAELSTALTNTLADLSGHAIASIHLTPREIIFNAPHPSIQLHVTDTAAKQVTIHLMQEIKRNIIFRRMNITGPPQEPTPLIRLQAHLLTVITKLISFLKYRGTAPAHQSLELLQALHQHIETRIA